MIGRGIVLLAIMFSVPAQAQSADKDKLAEVDRSFACPENLLDDAARRNSMKQYLLAVRAAWPDATIDEMIAFRKFLLNKHKCTKTLEAIQEQNQ